MANNYCLRTDILPFEIPALFSNEQLYKNPLISEKNITLSIQHHHSGDSSILGREQFLEKFCNFGNTISKPLYFENKMSKSKTRKMSLLHPGAQVKSQYFVIEYENHILDVMDSNFSYRLPQKRNKNTFSEIKHRTKQIKNWELMFNWNLGLTSEELTTQFRHYFSYKWTTDFGGMVNSDKVKQIQFKFSYSKKIDIQDFFPSIYTHSLAWALFGSKSVAKANQVNKSYFENQVDQLMMNINFNETNGIVVGPELSRIVAELLLVRVDKLVEREIFNKTHKENHKDYRVIRFVDDIFIFSNDQVLNDIIENAYSKALAEFNLSINQSKVKNFNDSQNVFVSRATEIQKAFDNFKSNNMAEFAMRQFKNPEDGDEEPIDYLGTVKSWVSFLDIINQVISSTPERKDILLNYTFSRLPSLLSFSKISVKQISAIMSGTDVLLKMNVTFKSIYHYIVFLSKILTQLENEIQSENDRQADSQINSSLVNKNTKIISIIFNHLLIILSANWFNINEGYDLVTFMNFFKKYELFIPAHILKSFIEKNKLTNDYFVLTSVTNYIYDSNFISINKKYLSVYRLIFDTLIFKMEYYKHEGINSLENGNFFYLLNDYYRIPGKKDLFKKPLTKKFPNEINKITKSNLSKHSYFQWGESFDYFLNRVLMKKIIHGNSADDSFTSI